MVHDVYILVLEKSKLGAGQEDLLVDLLQHTEADSRMSPSETQQESDRFSGGHNWLQKVIWVRFIYIPEPIMHAKTSAFLSFIQGSNSACIYRQALFFDQFQDLIS